MNPARTSFVISIITIVSSCQIAGASSPASAENESNPPGTQTATSDQSDPKKDDKAQLPLSGGAQSFSEPLVAERKQIRELIDKVRAKGFDVQSYEVALKQIDDSIHSGKPDDSLQGFVAGLIRNLNDQLNRKPPVVIPGATTDSTKPYRPSRKTSAEQYSEELRKCQEKQKKEHKKAMSKDFWQKFHDEFGKHRH